MRLFIAINLSEEAKKELRTIQKTLPKTYAINNNIHLTLKFLGETTPKQAEEIKTALSQIKFSPFKIELSQTGVFPNEKNPRVLWVGIKPEKGVIELQKKINKTLEKMFKPEKDFVPHITLARIKKLEKQSKLEIKPIHFEVKEFVLYESKLTPEGAKHEAIQRYAPQPL